MDFSSVVIEVVDFCGMVRASLSCCPVSEPPSARGDGGCGVGCCTTPDEADCDTFAEIWSFSMLAGWMICFFVEKEDQAGTLSIPRLRF